MNHRTKYDVPDMPKSVAGFRQGIWDKVHHIGIDTEDQEKAIDELGLDVSKLKKDSFRIKAVGSIVVAIVAFAGQIKKLF